MKSNGTLLNYHSFKEKLSLRILLSPEFCYGSLKHYQGFYYSHFTDKGTELAYSRWMVSVRCSFCSLDSRSWLYYRLLACLWDILPLELLSLLNSVHMEALDSLWTMLRTPEPSTPACFYSLLLSIYVRCELRSFSFSSHQWLGLFLVLSHWRW